ncbi:hypothetical protein [Paraferrimonas sedimenticola]|uniref:Uncharacterized protein n=1 Tax=Paraferrimonas sedimenticola TaxID=375674 RepID=A0AA37RVT0_9GAMM|nr:hypothetical protein [Paraferrimonas sedimenticola]GLP95714.1 hypothetical protein GCM10007895_10200 [Paraferrimonas sedimenticola]
MTAKLTLAIGFIGALCLSAVSFADEEFKRIEIDADKQDGVTVVTINTDGGTEVFELKEGQALDSKELQEKLANLDEKTQATVKRALARVQALDANVIAVKQKAIRAKTKAIELKAQAAADAAISEEEIQVIQLKAQAAAEAAISDEEMEELQRMHEDMWVMADEEFHVIHEVEGSPHKRIQIIRKHGDSEQHQEMVLDMGDHNPTQGIVHLIRSGAFSQDDLDAIQAELDKKR